MDYGGSLEEIRPALGLPVPARNTGDMMATEAKLSQEAIVAVEDKVMQLAQPLSDLERATLYAYLHHSGMTLQKVYEIRVKARAVN